MDLGYFIFLSSGLFLGWSLGANDAANIFGTAVGTKMVRFRTAALISSIFIILGAVFTGAGASKTLGELGSIDALAGAFMVALAAAVTIYWMVKLGLPVSTSQAIVGAIVGWNIYSGKPTEITILSQIVGTWIICPVLSGIIAILLYYLIRSRLKKSKIHILRRDTYTRIGLILVGAFGVGMPIRPRTDKADEQRTGASLAGVVGDGGDVRFGGTRVGDMLDKVV